MCKYREETSSARCKSMKNEMTPKMRKDLMRLHNEFRNKIAGGSLKGWPSAADMAKVTWDENLAKSAQRWATQCSDGHDKCRITPEFEVVGQNILRTASSTHEFNTSIAPWTNEIDEASVDLIEKYHFSPETGHFSQVVWAKTRRIGCGAVSYKRERLFWMVIVCNYGPSGNFIGTPMYTKGAPCAACPAGTKCNIVSVFPNLCA
ncbi:hypothetical protein GE061_003340 [Apolygus lucorum]|uniref:SCP domain-containing protein n=1 Tax=Apolygus lucorum TaxID=248454 RepID=A0A8S9X1W4_APOLU|nr:hypothetical protein GE061_003340 [Apolygus lucorum]